MSLEGVPDGDINELIKAREEELRSMHAFRNSQLEQMLRDRDSVLSQVRTKFEKLRNDFQHNLVLLEARDAEIRRLERALQELQASYAEQTQAASGVVERLKAAEVKLHAADHDRIEREGFWKETVRKLREEMENVRWSYEEEMKAKNREIDALKKDLHRQSAQQAQALEHQRLELTGTFEQLLKQREDEFAVHDDELAAKIDRLEQKFALLEAENTKLKYDNQQHVARISGLSDELRNKEAEHRQLEWKLEDSNNSKNDRIQHLERRLREVNAEFTTIRQNYEARIAALQTDLDKATIAHTAEQDAFEQHKAALDKQMDDIKAKFRQRESEIQKQYDANLAAIRQRDEQEIASLKTELSAARAKIDALTADVHERASTITQLEKELRRLQDRLQDASEAQQNAATEVQLLVQRLNSELSEAHDQCREKDVQLVELQRLLAASKADTSRVAEELQQCKTSLADSRTVEELTRQLQMAEVEKKNLLENAHEARKTIFQLQAEVQDLKSDNEALKLRNRIAESTNRPDAHTAMLEGNTNFSQPALQFSPYGPNSPMFSGDFGPASARTYRPADLESAFGQSGEHRFDELFQREAVRAETEATQRLAAENQKLTMENQQMKAENARLKDVIRGMRAEMEEEIRASSVPSSNSSESGFDTDIPPKHEWQMQLAKKGEEAARYKRERDHVMEISNERLAELNHERELNQMLQERVTQLLAASPAPPATPARVLLVTPTPATQPHKAAAAPVLTDSEDEPLEGARTILVSAAHVRPDSAKAEAIRASERATESQQRALQQLKAKHAESRTRSAPTHRPRKVMNYARRESNTIDVVLGDSDF